MGGKVMPCNSIRTVQVDIGGAAKVGAKFVLAALQSLGEDTYVYQEFIYFNDNQEWINTVTGESRISPRRDVGQIKAAIGKQVTMSMAKKFGWNIKQEGNKMVMMKGKF